MDRIDEFHEAMRKLIEVTAKVEDFNWGSFLLGAVDECADDETLIKMIAYIREDVNRREAKSHMVL